MKRIVYKKRPAQGLLETIVALSLLVTGAVSLLVLLVSSSVARSMSEFQTTAISLAREGIEVTRNLRDSNWMQGQLFDAGFAASHTYGLDFNPGIGMWGYDFSYSDLNSANSIVYEYTSGSYLGLMVQTSDGVAPSGAVKSVFRRIIAADPICNDGSIISSGNCSGSKIGMRVTATVQWQERGKTHMINVEERLYDWK